MTTRDLREATLSSSDGRHFIGLLHVPNCAVGVAVVAFVVLATGEEVGGVFGVKIAATDLLMLLKGDLEAVSDQDHVRATGLFQIAVRVGESGRTSNV